MRIWATTTTNSPPPFWHVFTGRRLVVATRQTALMPSLSAEAFKRVVEVESANSSVRNHAFGGMKSSPRSLPTSVFRSASPFQNVFVPFLKTLDSSRMWWFMVGIWRWKALRRWQFYLGFDEYLLDKRFKSVERLQECRAKIEIWVKNSDCFRKYLFMFHCYCCNKYI